MCSEEVMIMTLHARPGHSMDAKSPLTALCPGHFSGLCLQGGTLKDGYRSLSPPPSKNSEYPGESLTVTAAKTLLLCGTAQPNPSTWKTFTIPTFPPMITWKAVEATRRLRFKLFDTHDKVLCFQPKTLLSPASYKTWKRPQRWPC